MNRTTPLVVALACLALLSSCRRDAAPTPVDKPAEASPVQHVRVDAWHDTVCPWCRIGLHNLQRALENVPGVRVEVVHHAFLLEPDTPPGGTDLRARLAEKYGADRLAGMFDRVTQVGAAAGVRFNWDAVKMSPSAVASHALVAWAPDARRPDVIAAIHRAYFEEGADLGDVMVLSRLAGSVGLDAGDAARAVTDPGALAAVRAEAQQATRRGVRGVPHFEIGGRVLNGAQPPETLRAAIMDAARAR